MMLSHLTELKTSLITKATMAKMRLALLPPLMALLVSSATQLMAPMVERPSQKLNWFSERSLSCRVTAFSLALITRSNSFPVISNVKSGWYDDGFFGRLFSFSSSTNLCTFHWFRKPPSLEHALKVYLKMFEALNTMVLTRPGIPFGPRDFLRRSSKQQFSA